MEQSDKMVAKHKICAISVDMDPVYHYFSVRRHVPTAITNLNAVYEDALPRFLDLFDRHGVKATFFVVGKDAADPKNRQFIRDIARRGHEVANHTHNHRYLFANLSRAKKRSEIEEADKALSDIIGEKIRGFRAPGWGIDAETLQILESLGYSYDSSVFPSYFISLIAGVNFIMNKGKLDGGIGSRRSSGLCPKKPYVPSRKAIWKRGDMKIVELPPTVLPIIQLPFLGTTFYMLGKEIFSLSLRYFRMFRRPLLYELHGIELVDYYNSINDERLKVKPGMGKTIHEKMTLYNHMLSEFSDRYDFLTLKELGRLYT